MTTPGLHPIWFVAADGIQALDLVGPHDVFAAANQVADGLDVDGRRYRLEVISAGVSATGGDIRTESPLRLVGSPLPAHDDITGTIVIPGGTGARTDANDELVAWLRAAGPRADRIATVCTGAFLAARAGLLDGRRVATHSSPSDVPESTISG